MARRFYPSFTALSVALMFSSALAQQGPSVNTPTLPPSQETFTLTSTDVKEGGTLSLAQVAARCGGQDISPQLHWSSPPQGTKSFALMMYDPDAPTGSGWWHWVVYNIPADTQGLPSGAGTLQMGAPSKSEVHITQSQKEKLVQGIVKEKMEERTGHPPTKLEEAIGKKIMEKKMGASHSAPMAPSAPPVVATLPKGALQARNDGGVKAFGGACPPVGHGLHHYTLTLYALDVPALDIPEEASPAMVGFNVRAHSLGKASITATYSR